MSDIPPRIVYAGDRETDVPCTRCGLELQRGESSAICRSCGSLHHASCWEQSGGCHGYDCSGGTSRGAAGGGNRLKITADDLPAAAPLPVARTAWPENEATSGPEATKKRWNRIALWSFIVSLIGIPLFGLVTGIVAIVMGCVALVLHTANRRGMGCAVAAIVIGLADVLGWAAGLYHFHGGSGRFAISLDNFSVDPASLQVLPDHISRAMRANVLIQSQTGLLLLGTGEGSGVVLKIDGGTALIVTNRHVIDPEYSDSDRSQPAGDQLASTVIVRVLGQADTPGEVLWIAPHGVDLAVVSTAITSKEVREAHWRREPKLRIGDRVFAIGNPHGLGWTHTAGDISQLRRQSMDTFDYRVIQTSAAINPGNSGGGLYDAAGMLLGINTWTQDKRIAEGLGFSIALTALLDLIPDRFGLSENSPDPDTPEGDIP